VIHGLNNNFLYSAKKVIAKWEDGANRVEIRGTGFFVQKDNDIIFVTNRHVVEPGYSDPKYAGYTVIEFTIESFQSFSDKGHPKGLNSASVVNTTDFKFHSNPYNDVACIKNIQVTGGLTINLPIPYSFLATQEWLSDKLSVCDSIAYPGFPEWYDRQNNTPIFRMGTIASDPRLDYSHIPGAPIAARIAYEGFSSGGASGSPVFAVQRGFPVGGAISAPEDFYREVKLIGINAGHFSDEVGHSGISYLYKSSVIHDIINLL